MTMEQLRIAVRQELTGLRNTALVKAAGENVDLNARQAKAETVICGAARGLLSDLVISGDLSINAARRSMGMPEWDWR